MNPIIQITSIIFSWVALFSIGYIWGINDAASISNAQTVLLDGASAVQQNLSIKENNSCDKVIEMNEYKMQFSFMAIPEYEERVSKYPFILYSEVFDYPSVRPAIENIADYYNKYPFNALDGSGYIKYQKQKLEEFEKNFKENQKLFNKGLKIATKQP